MRKCMKREEWEVLRPVRWPVSMTRRISSSISQGKEDHLSRCQRRKLRSSHQKFRTTMENARLRDSLLNLLTRRKRHVHLNNSIMPHQHRDLQPHSTNSKLRRVSIILMPRKTKKLLQTNLSLIKGHFSNRKARILPKWFKNNKKVSVL